MKNPVARHINTFNKPSVVASKRRSLQSEATLREMSEVVLECQFDSESLCFDEDCNGCLNDIGSSSISVNTFEDEGEEL